MNKSEIWSGWYQGGKAAYLRPLRKIGTPPKQTPLSPELLHLSSYDRHYCIAPSCGPAKKKVHFMHQAKHGPGKLFHFSGVCFTSPWVFSQLLHYFWNQSCLPGMGLTFESITTCLHQNPQGNTEDDTGKMKESCPPAYFIAYFMRSVPVQRQLRVYPLQLQLHYNEQKFVW